MTDRQMFKHRVHSSFVRRELLCLAVFKADTLGWRLGASCATKLAFRGSLRQGDGGADFAYQSQREKNIRCGDLASLHTLWHQRWESARRATDILTTWEVSQYTHIYLTLHILQLVFLSFNQSYQYICCLPASTVFKSAAHLYSLAKTWAPESVIRYGKSNKYAKRINPKSIHLFLSEMRGLDRKIGQRHVRCSIHTNLSDLSLWEWTFEENHKNTKFVVL